MRFLVDAQLPWRLVRLLNGAGHDALHTSQLPDGSRTSDVRIAAIADREQRVVVTKDRDFRDSHLLAVEIGSDSLVLHRRRSDGDLTS